MKEDNKGLIVFLSILLGILIILFAALVWFTYENNQQWAKDYAYANQGWCRQVNMHRELINNRSQYLRDYDYNGWKDLQDMKNITCEDHIKW